MRRSLAAAAVLATILCAAPAQAEFRDVARALETRLGRRTFIPFLGFARAICRVASPRGIYDFQLAVFEDAPRIDGAELESLMQRHVGPGFTPMVRVRSKRESVFVYAKPGRGDRLDLTVLTQDGGDTVLVRVSVDAEIAARSFGEPRKMAAIGR